MSALINYFIEANLLLVAMYTLYLIAFRNESNFTFRRSLLYATIVATVLVPLLRFPQSEFIPTLSQLSGVTLLPELTIGQSLGGEVLASQHTPTTLATWLFIGYLLVAFTLLLIMIFRIGRLVAFLKGQPFRKEGKVAIVETDQPVPVFSFFHFIVIGSASSFSREEKEQIMAHERVHVRRLHSVDVLLGSVLRIVFWFNPLSWMIVKEFHEVHEYEADHFTTQSTDRVKYSTLLARMVLITNGFALASHFNKSITIKRIQMMNTLKRKVARWKIAVAIPIAIAATLVVACQDQLKDLVSDSTMALDVPAEVQTRLKEMKEQKPQAEFIVVEMNEQGKAKLHELGFENAETGGKFASMTLVETTARAKQEARTFAILEKGQDTNTLADLSKNDQEVFTIVEDAAKPVNGMTAFYDAIAARLKYTEKARQSNVEGRVFVEFVVNEDGGLSHFKVLKGIDPELDKLAVDAVAQAGEQWLPAKQRGKIVKQRMVLPITFSTSASAVSGQLKTDNRQFVIESSIQQLDGELYAIGKVVDRESNAPLTGAAIVVAGRTEGIVVDRQGEFKLKLPTKTGELVVSYIGYESKKISY